MYPILFRIGGFTVTSYGVMLVLAFVGAGVAVAHEFKRRGWDPASGQDVVLAAMLGGLVGSKLYWALSQWDVFLRDPFGLLLSRGGFTYYGGLVGGIVCVVLLLRWRRYPLGEAVNAVTPAVPVGYMLGRLGCFLVGDDYGHPTDLPWGIAFPAGSPPTTVPVHPTQLYEILLTLPIFLLLWRQVRRNPPPWFLLWEFLVLAGIERFIVEIWRLNERLALGFTGAQWISLGLIVVGMVGMWLAARAGAASTALRKS
jgi:phosphatidylglycerol:prolipoprotein diacylglycerol transferase